jgi:hypothetical protein
VEFLENPLFRTGRKGMAAHGKLPKKEESIFTSTFVNDWFTVKILHKYFHHTPKSLKTMGFWVILIGKSLHSLHFGFAHAHSLG